MKITVETHVKADLGKVWDAYNNPADIKQWNAAQDDWHTTSSTVDLREGGTFMSRMEAKDGSEGFDSKAPTPASYRRGSSNTG
ncbi:SRPBCC domain-containing protein [Stutzerimonas nitrititolerans]|uniref:SRPBCC domain-containing protein n=1 Tax=Stutzerimonas nitrititolerans TaxID=2482751 RepID=UPI0035E418E3